MKTYQIPNKSLDLLVRHVQRRLGSQVRKFRVLVSEQGLVLFGKATNFYGKQLAFHYVREATEKPILANEIEVVYAR